mmetsp:Transcript_6542/g.11534  ORF Transcript_6542/g.11534 Transcript_6542/m.11534 type:complete len:207 (-) Transcript_6542:97-717(-)
MKKLQADSARLQERLAELRGQLNSNGFAASDYNNSRSNNNGGRSNGAKGRATTSKKDPLLELDMYRQKKAIDLQYKHELAEIDELKRGDASDRKKKHNRKKRMEVASNMRLITRAGAVKNGMFDAEGMMGLVNSLVLFTVHFSDANSLSLIHLCNFIRPEIVVTTTISIMEDLAMIVMGNLVFSHTFAQNQHYGDAGNNGNAEALR